MNLRLDHNFDIHMEEVRADVSANFPRRALSSTESNIVSSQSDPVLTKLSAGRIVCQMISKTKRRSTRVNNLSVWKEDLPDVADLLSDVAPRICI